MVIYKLTSPSNKTYIGKTKFNLQKRLKQHVRAWTDLSRSRTKIYNAFSKYGPPIVSLLTEENKIEDPSALSSWKAGNWLVQIIFECDDANELNEKEKYFIEYYNTTENGYNICRGGEGNTSPCSDHVKQILHDKMAGRSNYWLKGVSPTNKGKSPSSETLKKLSESHLGQQAWNKGISGEKSHSYGRVFSEERKQKISKAQKGRIGGPMSGRHHSEESKEKSRLSNLGKKRSLECRQNNSAAKSSTWNVITPSGENLTVFNLRKFCIDNGLNNSNITHQGSRGFKAYKLSS